VDESDEALASAEAAIVGEVVTGGAFEGAPAGVGSEAVAEASWRGCVSDDAGGVSAIVVSPVPAATWARGVVSPTRGNTPTPTASKSVVAIVAPSRA